MNNYDSVLPAKQKKSSTHLYSWNIHRSRLESPNRRPNRPHLHVYGLSDTVPLSDSLQQFWKSKSVRYLN